MMNTKSKRHTRYIKNSVCHEVLGQSRYRCCLSDCRSRILLPEQVNSNHLYRILHKHHLIFYSDGGPPTTENLVLVCPNCHATIHRFPSEYPFERLRRDKSHWLDMKNVVAGKVLVASTALDPMGIGSVAIPFSL